MAVDSDTVALYTMNAPMNRELVDLAGAHNGTLEGNTTVVAGAPSCGGDGIRFSGSQTIQGWLEIPDSDDWESIDLGNIHTLAFRCSGAPGAG